MRILIPISAETDTATLLDYVARRFVGTTLDVDLLLTDPRPRLRRWLGIKPSASSISSTDAAHAVQRAMAEMSEIRSVRRHTDNSDTAHAILAFSQQLKSDIILLDAPNRPGLLTAFGMHSATRRVLCGAPCAVELLRPPTAEGQGTFNLLLAVEASRLQQFPFCALQQLKWPQQTRLRVYAVVPPSVDWRRSEACASSLLLARQRDELEAMRVEVRLNAVCQQLARQLGTVGEVSFQVVHGSDQHITTHLASATNTSLIVLDNAASELSFGANPSLMSPATIALTAPCAILFLPEAATSRAAETSTEAVFSLDTP